jgi:cobalt-zinc-cadmium efflux system membrane fusion protein
MSHRHLLICAALLPLLLASCGTEPVAAPAAPIKAVPPATAVAQPASNAPIATVPATVTLPPAARVAVTAPFSGAVRQIHVLEGQEVEAGQLLATVISRDALTLASDRARADARLALARANAARIGQLAAEGVVAGARADEAQAASRVAEADRAEADRILRRGGASDDGTVRLVAPISGRVSRVSVETGGPLDGLTAPFVIDGSNRYALHLQLPERLAGKVRPGMAVLLPGGARGEIVSVAPGLDPETRSLKAIARIGSAPGLVAGGSLSVTILGDGGDRAVAVPADAVTRLDGRDVVFVRAREGFVARPVAVGGTVDGQTTIVEGLAVGAVVATSNLPELKSQAAR